jgi:hypothetical protein
VKGIDGYQNHGRDLTCTLSLRLSTDFSRSFFIVEAKEGLVRLDAFSVILLDNLEGEFQNIFCSQLDGNLRVFELTRF